jgi:flagellar basal-body rod modification protein FlgD
MSRISATNFASQSPSKSTTDVINDIDLGTFLQLLITEMQNQDPLNPLDNKDMLAQISQLREVGATDKLTSTLNSVLLGQSIASATNLIGAEIDAVSDDNQKVTGIVKQVAIEDGDPRLIIDSAFGGTPSIETGNMEQGKYSYRVVWLDANGEMKGLELSGDDAVSTLGGNNYQSVKIDNLPQTPGPKQIYRTDKSGTGDYQLVTTIMDGSQSSYLDTAADAERSETRQTAPFDRESIIGRRFRVRLSNVGEIRVPKVPVNTGEPDPTNPDESDPTDTGSANQGPTMQPKPPGDLNSIGD